MLFASAPSLPWYLFPALPAVAILYAAGCGELARLLERWRRAPLIVAVLLAALLGARVVTAWQQAQTPVLGATLQRFESVAGNAPGRSSWWCMPVANRSPGTGSISRISRARFRR